MFKVYKTKIHGVYIINPEIYGDHRGFFMESWNKKKFEELGLNLNFIQDNHSKSKKGVLRGIHFQTKHSQGKLVRVIKGAVFDVAVDLRPNSPTFGKYESIILSEANKKMFYVPEQFGHAYLTLSKEAEFLYKTTDYYYPEYDSGIIWDDPDINISWPVHELVGSLVILSDKDKELQSFLEYKMMLYKK